MADDATDLIKALSTNANLQAAKFGGRTPSGKFGGLLDILLPAYQAAFPKAPAANLAMGARQGYNLRQYNKALYGQEQEALRQQNLRKQAVGGHYAKLGVPQAVDPQGNPVYLEDSQYKQLAETYGNKQGGEGYERAANGQAPKFGALTPIANVQNFYDNNVLKPNREAIEREGFYKQINQQNPYALPGQQPAPPPAPQGQFQQGNFEGDPALPQGLGALQAKPQLSAGAAYNDIPTPMERFTQGLYLPDPKDIISGATQKETGRHNFVTEGETKANNAATQKLNRDKFGLSQKEFQEKVNGKYFKKYPPSGGGSQPNQTTAALGLGKQLRLTPQQQLQALLDPQGFFLDYEGPPPPAPKPTKPNLNIGRGSANKGIKGKKGTYVIP